MRVNEIFYSLQGEGCFTGSPAVFLRLSGCNTRCPFCDTQHSSYKEMQEDEIVGEIMTLWGCDSKEQKPHIVITGGEPTLQLTASLVQKLHDNDCFVQIETNGSLPLPEEVDWITCSPKDLPVAVGRIDELKALFTTVEEMANLEATVLRHHQEIKELRLQPIDNGNEKDNRERVNETINYILKHPKWKLSLQTHKMLNIR